jgi:hypothetical protein
MHFRFSSTALSDDHSESLAQMVQEPAIAPADPAYACATGAMGHFCHDGDPMFAAVDDGLDFLLESIAVEPTERCRLYGKMRYGNMVCSHASGPCVAYTYWKDKDPERALRYVGPYNNESNDQILAVWGNFLRTGRRDHFLLAQRYSRTVADVAFCHAHPSRPGDVGLMHYHNAHQWTGQKSPSHSLVAGILTDYYATGNRRLLDVAREVGDWAVRNQEPCGIVSNRNGVLHREFVGPLWALFDVYRATWEEKYGDLARRSLNWFLRALPGDAQYPVNIYTRGARGDEAVCGGVASPPWHARDMYHIYEAALLICDSQQLRRRILTDADCFVWDELTDKFVTADMARTHLFPRSEVWPIDDSWYWTNWAVLPVYNTPLVCLAYDLTGDLVYAAYAKDVLMGRFRQQVERSRHNADWDFSWLRFGSFIPRLMRIAVDATQRDPEGLAAKEREWRDKRAAKGLPVYDGPNVDFTEDVMGPNGQLLNRPPVDLPREKQPRPDRDPEVSMGRLSTGPHDPPD